MSCVAIGRGDICIRSNLENGKAAARSSLAIRACPGDSWMDSEKASADLGRFCRQMELEADREGLMLMARAGYHPDFVPALHHLLHASGAFRRMLRSIRCIRAGRSEIEN